jgi:hypothetical protein
LVCSSRMNDESFVCEILETKWKARPTLLRTLFQI